MSTGFGTACRLLLVTVLLGACGSTQRGDQAAMTPAQGRAECGLCCDRDPTEEARATQGVSAVNPNNKYDKKDDYTNITLAEGTVLYSLTPGRTPGFAVTEDALREAAGDQKKFHALVQVSADSGKDANGKPRPMRHQVRAFHVAKPLCVASGKVAANTQFGSGGATQYYVSPADVGQLRTGAIVPLSHWQSPW